MLASTIGLLVAFALPMQPTAAQPPALAKKTYTYKTVGDLKIQADVYRPDDTKVRPVVVWIHGGALIMGARASTSKLLVDLCRDEGYALVSIDYRLAPEVKLPEIIADLDDFFRWLREAGPKLLNIDPDRMVVAGSSAGGYLTLMLGVRLKVKPRALVAYWGYGDVDGDWYTKPSEYYRTSEPIIAKENALKAVQSKPITGSEPGIQGRQLLYHYYRQNGMWTKEVTGFDPTEKAKLDPYCPVRNVTANYPPTMLLHGTDDTDVPYSLAVDMDKELTRNKVPHELVTVLGSGHGLKTGDKKAIDKAFKKSQAFIREHMNEEQK